MDLQCSRDVLEQPDQAVEALQIYRHMCYYAEEWRRSPYCQLLLLGQHNRRQLHRQMGEQDHVLHCERVRSVYLNQGCEQNKGGGV